MNEINGRTRICGLMANPVEHTMSPLIHNTLAQRMGVNMAYVPFKPQRDGLAAAVRGAYELNVLGLNVSVPYKAQVMESLAALDPMAEAIGAVNTLVRIDGGYKGYNTDIMGLKRAMLLEGVPIKDRKVIILGAGGASRAITHLCVTEGAEKIWILNRTLKNAEAIAGQVNACCKTDCVTALATGDFKTLPRESYLVIQTTNVGMYPDTDSAVIEDRVFYELADTAYDLIYTPFTTRFMKNAADCGAKTFNGLRMLLYQGVCAFELWNRVAVPEELSEEIYRLLKKELTA